VQVQRSPSGEVILLTGSTGFLGSHLLATLLQTSTVSRVYAINRPSSVSLQDRQVAAFRKSDLSSDLLKSPKLVLLEGDLSKVRLGLDENVYNEIVARVTCVIHNGTSHRFSAAHLVKRKLAWRVDFNVSLSSMEPLILGTRRLIDLALSSPLAHPPSFVFVSSVAIFDGMHLVVCRPSHINKHSQAGSHPHQRQKLTFQILRHPQVQDMASPSGVQRRFFTKRL
jgi:thioester reductase-like protein